MRLMVILPAEKSAYPAQEIELRRAYLQNLVSQDTNLEIGFMQGGACFKGVLAAEDFDRGEEIVAPAREAEQAGVDAVMVHCVYDPGVASASAAVNIPVIGPGEATLVLIRMLGKKFGVIAPTDSLIPRTYEIMARFGLSEKVTPMGALNIPLSEAHQRREELKQKSVELGRQAIAQGAELILPFGLALIPTHLSCEDLAQELGVPVINPAGIGIKMAELAGQIGAAFKE